MSRQERFSSGIDFPLPAGSYFEACVERQCEAVLLKKKQLTDIKRERAFTTTYIPLEGVRDAALVMMVDRERPIVYYRLARFWNGVFSMQTFGDCEEIYHFAQVVVSRTQVPVMPERVNYLGATHCELNDRPALLRLMKIISQQPIENASNLGPVFTFRAISMKKASEYNPSLFAETSKQNTSDFCKQFPLAPACAPCATGDRDRCLRQLEAEAVKRELEEIRRQQRNLELGRKPWEN